MAIEDYWASSTRILNDLIKYVIYPVSKIVGYGITKNSHAANAIAGALTTSVYAGIAEVFLGREMEGFDKIARPAVAAEFGKREQDITFEDYLKSQNHAVRARMDLLKKENLMRYSASLLPMLPTAMEYVTRGVKPGGPAESPHVKTNGSGRTLASTGETRWSGDRKPAPNASFLEHAMHGWGLWDTAVYGAVSALWLLETYGIDKTFIYQARKEMENSESLGLKIGPNNIAGLYNRMRGDRDLEIIDKKDRDKIWPLFEMLAEKVNANKFALPELTYLMGMGKLDIFAKDAKGRELHNESGELIVDQNAYKKAMQEISWVEHMGLKGIAEQRRKLGIMPKTSHLGLVDKFTGKWFDAHFDLFTTAFGKRKKYVEVISPRDPSENPMSI